MKAAFTVAAGLLILSLFIVALGGHRFWEEQDVYVINFRSIKDLAERRPVKYAGLNIGRVLEIDVSRENPGVIAVTVGVKKDFPLHEGTRASISQKGLVGDNYVLLGLYGEAGPRLQPGAVIPAAPAADFQQVLGAMNDLIGTLKPRLEEIAEGLSLLVSPENRRNVALTLERAPVLLAQAEATLARLDSEIGGIGSQARARLAQGGELLTTLQTRLDTTMDKVDATIVNADAAVGNASRDWSATLADVRRQVNTVGGRVTSLTENLESSLEYDQERIEIVLENVDELVIELRKLSRSLRERPWQVIYQPEERALQ